MLLFASIIFFSGQAVGSAGKALCKEAVAASTGWAIPPKTIRGDQMLLLCVQDYQGQQDGSGVASQRCFYANEAGTGCSVMLDLPGEDQWRGLAVDCLTGKPIKEQKL